MKQRKYRPDLEPLEGRALPSAAPATAYAEMIGANTVLSGVTPAAIAALKAMPIPSYDLSAQDRSMIGPQTRVMVYPQSTPLPPCVRLPLTDAALATFGDAPDAPVPAAPDALAVDVLLALRPAA